IYRHAKAQKAPDGTADFDRELAPRGLRQSAEMAGKLREKGIQPDLVISSPAARARRTAEITLETLASPQSPLEAADLYGSDGTDYLKVIARSGDGATRLAIVGHNPSCEELLELLTGEALHLGTASIAWIRLPIDSWKDFSRETRGTLVEHLKAETV
ncbi:MAG: SixA phosphatase family protein, partial [Spirochaetota bacterium]